MLRSPKAHVVGSASPHIPSIIFIVLITAAGLFWQLTAAGRQRVAFQCIFPPVPFMRRTVNADGTKRCCVDVNKMECVGKESVVSIGHVADPLTG